MFTRFLAILCMAAFCAAKEIPDFLIICKRNDPDLNECLKKSMEHLKPTFVTGSEEYNIPSLEPLYMEELIRDQQGGLQITANNVKCYGSSNYFVKDVKIDTTAQRYDVQVELPGLRIEADYGVDGKVFLLPIRGSGPMSANVTDVLATVMLMGDISTRDGDEYLSFKSFDLKVKIGGGTGRLDNLFNGDKVLGDIINDTINKNMDAFLKELLPIIEKNLAAVFLKIANNIVTPFTFEQLFPTN